MTAVCAGCGADFDTKRSHARYCSAKCRQRGSRAASPEEVAEIAGQEPGGIVAAVTRELESLGKVDTMLGQQALAVATAMASGRDTGSAVASLSRELSRLMTALGSGAAAEVDPIDEVRKRRERKEAKARASSG